MRRFTFLLAMFTLIALQAGARIWRINNNAGTDPDFTDIPSAIANASVLNGDTLHIEPSSTIYTSFTLSKQLIFIGSGYLLGNGPNDNPGLQANPLSSTLSNIFLTSTSQGSKFIGMTISSSYNLPVSSGTYTANITFEKCRFNYDPWSSWYYSTMTVEGFTYRKCWFSVAAYSATNTSLNNFVVENCIFSADAGAPIASIWLRPPSGTGFVFRNNVVNASQASYINNCYVANNIFINTTNAANDFSFSNVKNNLFTLSSAIQSLPAGATGNLFSQNAAAIFTGTGSSDGRWQLAAGSPAIGFGVTVGAVTSPDAGPFGGTDPYKLSGIPAIPTIYSLTVPVSINQGQATMTVTMSTRNNN